MRIFIIRNHIYINSELYLRRSRSLNYISMEYIYIYFHHHKSSMQWRRTPSCTGILGLARHSKEQHMYCSSKRSHCKWHITKHKLKIKKNEYCWKVPSLIEKIGILSLTLIIKGINFQCYLNNCRVGYLKSLYRINSCSIHLHKYSNLFLKSN